MKMKYKMPLYSENEGKWTLVTVKNLVTCVEYF